MRMWYGLLPAPVVVSKRQVALGQANDREAGAAAGGLEGWKGQVFSS